MLYDHAAALRVTPRVKAAFRAGWTNRWAEETNRIDRMMDGKPFMIGLFRYSGRLYSRLFPADCCVVRSTHVCPCFVSRLAKERARLKKHEKEGRMQPDPEIVKGLLEMFSENVSCCCMLCTSARRCRVVGCGGSLGHFPAFVDRSVSEVFKPHRCRLLFCYPTVSGTIIPYPTSYRLGFFLTW